MDLERRSSSSSSSSMRGSSLLRIWPWLLTRLGYTRLSTVDQPHQAAQRDVHFVGHSECVEARFGKRHELIILLFSGFIAVYAMRVNLSVAIVAMVGYHPLNRTQVKLNDNTCPLPAPRADSATSEMKGEFNWDERTQGMILGSFFYGYLLTNYLGGRLASKFGGRIVYGLGISLTAVLTIISPLAARRSTFTFAVIRFLEGMTEGVTFPAMNDMISFWIPPQERARSITRIVGGCHVGTVLTLSVSGWLMQTWGGWPSVFYLSGIYSLVWGWFWFKYSYDLPEQHPSISTAEKLYIKQGVGEHRKNQGLDVPWRSIMTSIPFLAVIVQHVGHNWGYYCMLTELPTYLRNVQHYNLKENGFVSAMPYLMSWLFTLVYSSLMDHLLVQGVMATITIRQLSMVIANFVPMISLLLVTWAGCNSTLVITIICFAIATSGASLCGMHCAFQELAPNFSGTLTGISNTMATIPGFLAPAVTGIIINNQQTLSRWEEVFQLVAAIYLVVGILYMMFMSVEVQPWNETSSDSRRLPLKENAEVKTV